MADQADVKHADLQHATKDINEVFGLKQSHITKRQTLIDFIVNTINGCIGPDPENAEQSIWTDNRASDLKPETITAYTALVTTGAATEEPELPAGAEAEAAEKAEASDGLTGSVQPDECPSFGKDRDPNDPACTEECQRTEECAQVIEAKAAKKNQPKKERTSSGVTQFVDNLLLEGGHTVETIAADVKDKFPDNKQLGAKGGINAHMKWREKSNGWTITRHEDGTVTAVKPAAVAAA